MLEIELESPEVNVHNLLINLRRLGKPITDPNIALEYDKRHDKLFVTEKDAQPSRDRLRLKLHGPRENHRGVQVANQVRNVRIQRKLKNDAARNKSLN